MTLIESGQNLSESTFHLTKQHIIDNSFIQFDSTLLNSSTCGDSIATGLTGKYVLAEECTRFVFEHCVGKLRFFMIISAIFLYVIIHLSIKHGYWEKEIDWLLYILKTIWNDLKNIFKKGDK